MEKIDFETDEGVNRTSVLSYEISGLVPGRFYTVAVYQFVKKEPKIRSLTVNVTTDGKGKKVYPLKGLVGTARGRRVYVDLYEQKGSLKPPKESSEVFNLPSFREEENLTLLDSQYVLYITTPPKKNRDYFNEWNDLTEKEGKYCRCVLHVAAKNTATCNTSHKWGSGACYNPYAVCAKSTKTSVRFCGMRYEWEKIPTEELRAFAELHKMSITAKTTRRELVKMLRFKTSEEVK